MSFRIVVVGRPNVGKSALFNRLVGHRRSLVHDLPGMTRDVIEEETALPDGRKFVVVDTGGFDPSDQEKIPAEVRRRALDEIAAADFVFLVMDASAASCRATRRPRASSARRGNPASSLPTRSTGAKGAKGSRRRTAWGSPR